MATLNTEPNHPSPRRFLRAADRDASRALATRRARSSMRSSFSCSPIISATRKCLRTQWRPRATVPALLVLRERYDVRHRSQGVPCGSEPVRTRRSRCTDGDMRRRRRKCGHWSGRRDGTGRARCGGARPRRRKRALAALNRARSDEPRLRDARSDCVRPAHVLQPALLAERLYLVRGVPSARPQLHR